VVLSAWRVALLEAVARTGSLSASAAERGGHFRVAWRKLQEMEEGLGVQVTQRSVGGQQGGGTSLTPEGQVDVRHVPADTAGLKDLATRPFQSACGPD
jgi:molybdate transport system regulatory protein